MTETFRLRKSVKYQGMAFAAIFLAALVGYASIFFLEDPTKHGFKREHSVAIVGGMGLAVFGTMFLLSIYIWAAYYVERFSVDGTTLSIRSMLQNHQFDVSELQSVKWRASPMSGSILFRFLDSKARLDLYGYADCDRLRIVRVVHDVVPGALQEGWPEFCHLVALPLRDDKSPIVRSDPSCRFYTITRKRYDRALRLALPVSIGVSVALWSWLHFQEFFALPFLVIAGWLLLRLNVPREGRTEVQFQLSTSPMEGRAQLIGAGGIIGSVLLMGGLPILGVEKSIACLVACIPMGTAFPPMIYFLYKCDKQRRNADKQAAEMAAALWQQGEGITVKARQNENR